ncbi:MAG: glycosyltransferase family 4 protein [Bacillota bacterium]|nr:glycosyltransferase family 4 protein [Bacillota bacterium]
MKNIIVITNFTSLPGELGYNRFRYICDLLTEHGHNVTLLTSSFNHYDKKQRNESELEYLKCRYKIELIYEKGYKKNISFRRISSQKQFARNVKKFLQLSNIKYDAIYCCVPTLETAKVCGNYADSLGIPFIIDVQDLWPEAMRMVIHIPFITDLFCCLMKRQANKVYGMADYIVAVSNEYLKRALEVNTKSKENAVVYIGSYIEEFNKGVKLYSDNIVKKSDEFWIIYVGTLGKSYDIRTLIRAHKILLDKGYENIKLKILGRGQYENELREYSREIKAETDFEGFKEYGKMAAYLRKSDIAINSIVAKSAASIINKVGDYFAAGLPVLNSSQSKEMKKLIEDFNTGINYIPGDALDLSEKIEYLYKSPDICAQMGKNSIRLAAEKFNRSNTYMEIVKLIESI